MSKFDKTVINDSSVLKIVWKPKIVYAMMSYSSFTSIAATVFETELKNLSSLKHLKNKLVSQDSLSLRV